MPKNALSKTAFVALCAFVLLSVLVNISFGRADNGDFARAMSAYVTAPVGLDLWPAFPSYEWRLRFFGYYIPEWVYVRPGIEATATRVTSAHIVFSAGNLLNKALYSETVLNLRIFAALLYALVALPFLLIARATISDGTRIQPANCAALALIAFLVFDVNVTSFFGSFYPEGPAAAFFALALVALFAWCAAERTAAHHILAFAGSVWLLALAKPQHFHVAITGALVLLAMIHGLNASPRLKAGLAAASITLCAAVVYAATFLGAETRRTNAYHSLYAGILTQSENPAAHLERLGLTRPDLVGKSARVAADFIAATPALSHRNTLAVALAEPTALGRLVLHAAGFIGDLELRRLGKIAYHEEMRPGESAFAWDDPRWRVEQPKPGIGLWSRSIIARHLTGTTYLLAIAVLIAGSAFLAARPGPFRKIAAAILFLAASSIAELVVAVLGDGLIEAGKHLFAANLFLGGAVVFAAYAVLRSGARHPSPTGSPQAPRRARPVHHLPPSAPERP